MQRSATRPAMIRYSRDAAPRVSRTRFCNLVMTFSRAVSPSGARLIENLSLRRIVLDDARPDCRERRRDGEPDRAIDDEVFEVGRPSGIACERTPPTANVTGN